MKPMLALSTFFVSHCTSLDYVATFCPSGRIEKYQIKGSRSYYMQHKEVTGAGLTSLTIQYEVALKDSARGPKAVPSVVATPLVALTAEFFNQ
jgi:hypothetical protein